MKKTVICDFNGTIIDDVGLCLDIENRMLKERGMKYGYTIEQYLDMFCFPVIDYYYKLGYTFEHETYDDISVEFNELYDRGFLSAPLKEGFMELIRKSIDAGNKNVILSATKQDKLRHQTKQLGIAQYFDEILGIDNLLAGSKIGMAKRWMEFADVHPDDCMYIGDTLHDLDTAKALGIQNCILVAGGHSSVEVLRQNWDNVVMSLKEVEL